VPYGFALDFQERCKTICRKLVIVSYDKAYTAFLRHFDYRAAHKPHIFGIKTACGFVKEKYLFSAQAGKRYRKPLLLPSRKLRRVKFGIFRK